MDNSNYSKINSFNAFNNISTNSPFGQREIDQSKNSNPTDDKTFCFMMALRFSYLSNIFWPLFIQESTKYFQQIFKN